MARTSLSPLSALSVSLFLISLHSPVPQPSSPDWCCTSQWAYRMEVVVTVIWVFIHARATPQYPPDLNPTRKIPLYLLLHKWAKRKCDTPKQSGPRAHADNHFTGMSHKRRALRIIIGLHYCCVAERIESPLSQPKDTLFQPRTGKSASLHSAPHRFSAWETIQKKLHLITEGNAGGCFR